MKNQINIVHISEGINENSVPNRLHVALSKYSVQSNILTLKSTVGGQNIYVISRNIFVKILTKIDYLLLKLEQYIFYHNEEGFPYSFYRVGVNISKNTVVKNADIIVLHWICGSFVSMHGLKKLIALKKPIVWICHDNWPFTGGCHVRLGCEKYREECGKCPQLQSGRQKDWSYRLLSAKKKIISEGRITIISPSTWMDDNVAKSSLFSQFKHYVIPNPINTDKFISLDRRRIRKRYSLNDNDIIILFGAVNATSTPYKGYSYLMQALELLEKNWDNSSVIKVVVFGASNGIEKVGKRIVTEYLGYLNENQMVEAYNLADVYVVPSLEDSFNNTVAEALACTTPVVAFATGGIKDIINHKENGYLAKYEDANDLARGIAWVLTENKNNILGINGRKKVEVNYKDSVVAQRHIELYKKICEDSLGK